MRGSDVVSPRQAGCPRGERSPLGAVSWLALCVLCTAAIGCGSDGERAGDDGLGTLAAPSCRAPDAVPMPDSIAETVEWINRLPKPLSLPCFVETLPRPLTVYASESLFSAQPAVGRRSPRMFLFSRSLIMSITPDGEGSHLLEFGEPRSSRTSLKGEIVFPVTGELGPSSPYDHVIFDGTTTCGGCHGEEEPDPSIDYASAFVSRALRPAPAERVGLGELHGEALECDALAEPERCAMLAAVFGPGELIDAEFPATLDTFY